MDALTINERLLEAHQRIRTAEVSAGRQPGSVRLLAVSKTQSADAVRAAYEAGQRDFGENYIQELAQKAAALADLKELRWHVIGHVQTNKARVVAPIAACIHTVDSLRLAEELNRRLLTHAGTPGTARPTEGGGALGSALGARLPIMLEVNVGGESQKSGCAPTELAGLLAAVRQLERLQVVGLMTVPPFGREPEESRPHFEKLRALRDEHGGSAKLPELSMGMSADCEVAIACDATWVRLGSAIFGARQPKSA